MGFDITLRTNNNDAVFGGDYHDPEHDYFHQHSLSRTFCNLMCRGNVIEGEPELDQIGAITSVDISPFYQMESYGGGGEIDFLLEMAESETDRLALLAQAEQSRNDMKGNAAAVLATVNTLLAKLADIDNLPEMLDDSGYPTIDYEDYFTDFKTDKGDGYIGNNFGQDLRNFRRFVEFAQTRGADTVYFSYG